jgi:hypothetical protein
VPCVPLKSTSSNAAGSSGPKLEAVGPHLPVPGRTPRFVHAIGQWLRSLLRHRRGPLSSRVRIFYQTPAPANAMRITFVIKIGVEGANVSRHHLLTFEGRRLGPHNSSNGCSIRPNCSRGRRQHPAEVAPCNEERGAQSARQELGADRRAPAGQLADLAAGPRKQTLPSLSRSRLLPTSIHPPTRDLSREPWGSTAATGTSSARDSARQGLSLSAIPHLIYFGACQPLFDGERCGIAQANRDFSEASLTNRSPGAQRAEIEKGLGF